MEECTCGTRGLHRADCPAFWHEYNKVMRSALDTATSPDHPGAPDVAPAAPAGRADHQGGGMTKQRGNLCPNCGVPEGYFHQSTCASLQLEKDKIEFGLAQEEAKNRLARQMLDRVATADPGRKFDQEKPRFDLLVEGMPRALEEVARVLTFGSIKYEDHNWMLVSRAEHRYLAAGMRHEMAYQRGEPIDPDSGLHHLAHKLCCDLFRLELAMREGDGCST